MIRIFFVKRITKDYVYIKPKQFNSTNLCQIYDLLEKHECDCKMYKYGWRLTKKQFKKVAPELYNSFIEPFGMLKLKPYKYQKEAIIFILNRLSCLLRMCCGAGKTLCIIGAYSEAIRRGTINTQGLIVVKASLKKQWEQEVFKFSYFIPCIIKTKSQLCVKELKALKKCKSSKEKTLLKSKIDRKFNLQFENCDLFILNYEALLNPEIKAALHKKKIQFIASDESHYIKSHKSQRTLALHEFYYAKIKIGSTATPIQKNYEDIFGIFKFLTPALFSTFSRFAGSYIKYSGPGIVSGFKNIDKLMAKIKPFIFTKTEEDIGSQLPEVVGPIQFWCDLDLKVQEKSDAIFEALQELKDRQFQLAKNLTPAQKETNEEILSLDGQILAHQAMAQMLCNSPKLLDMSKAKTAEHYRLKKYQDIKLDLLMDKITEIVDANEKVCVFSKFIDSQKIIEEAFLKKYANNKSTKAFYIAKVTGEVVNDDRYDEVYTKFRDDPNCKVLLATNALAEGANLTACKYLIEFDLADSFAIQKQRHGRIRRADSVNRTVFVYQILARNSWDDIALKIVSKKEGYDASLSN